MANIIHGITGFAGTILAMPFGIKLVGYEVAKPILNVLAIFSGIYVFIGNRKSVNWKELIKIVAIMTVGILGGVFIKGLFVGKEQILYMLLGIFVIGLAVKGLFTMDREEKGESKF
ncbi:MAG: sulfite exporter TauE/SafE family protein, partial [Agathobacter sp.]|nr:sulfite exporter TauE/SafE family protein [Agathobacter sp.]